MLANDPKKDQSSAGGGTQQQGAYPLERYTVAPKSEGSGDEKSPYYKSAAPSISLPKGGGALKGIDEKFSVNAVNGTSSLQVPLPFTPGRAGFTPSLSLSYNSGGGNSEFGLGWNLGLPSIQRKTDKKLPLYDDANDSDVFLLAGAEDLIPELNSSGLPLISTPTGYIVKRYIPRIEGLFARIEHITKNGVPGSWWKVTSKENTVSYYGLTPAARVADPEDSNRVFKWLPELSFDNKGNVQRYNYVTDSSSAIVPGLLHERNRINGLSPFTNTYLKNVEWCNVVQYFPSHDYEPSFLISGADPDYKMVGVLDYGNYDAGAPSITDNNAIPVRIDPFSDFHAGFEIRTYRKCRRVLMFHLFDELINIPTIPVNSCLVRSLDFTYFHDGSTALEEADFITKVIQKGYLITTSGTYQSQQLPAMQLSYNARVWDKTVHRVSPGDLENAPQGLSGSYQWIDLWGEGIPGILTEQGQGWFYKSNLGDGHFNAATMVAAKPSFAGLGSSMQWQDLDADGKRQLVSHNNQMPGYFELDDDQKWQSFRAFKQWAHIDWDSPFTKMLDLNGDGKPDVLLTEDRAWKWFENEGTDGYAEGGYAPVTHDEEKGPRMLHNDMLQAIFLADMGGDGMTDIVRIQNGEVCYWPNKGYGRFGAKVTMSNAPIFDQPDIFNPKYLTLSDISGTGAADLIYVGKSRCTAWINLAGNGFSDAQFICPLPVVDQYSNIAVMDLLGNGTGCVVWSSQLPGNASSPMRYIDLMGGNKPYLMNGYSNGMGKEVALTYKQSTKYYLEDKLAMKPWVTRLPFPVHCVAKVTTIDRIGNTSYSQSYSYHHGYYDHDEREFRGFGRVETIDTDIAYALDDALSTGHLDAADLNQAPVKTISWYHTGAWMKEKSLLQSFNDNEYYHPSATSAIWAELPTTPDMPTGMTAKEQREAHRALKGQLLRQEVYALDQSADQAKPYVVTTHAYAVKRIQATFNNRHASFFSYNAETLTYSCERTPGDARILHELTLGTDLYGNITKSAKVAYPRYWCSAGSPGTTGYSDVDTVQGRMLCTYTENDYTNDINTGSIPYRLRQLCNTCTYEITGLSSVLTRGAIWGIATLDAHINGSTTLSISAATLIDYTAPLGSGREKRKVSHARTTFLADDAATILSLGQIRSLGLPYRQYHLAITHDMLTHPDWYKDSYTGIISMIGTGSGYLEETAISEFTGSTPTPVANNWWLPGGTINFHDTGGGLMPFFTPHKFIDPWGNETTIGYWSGSGTNYYLLPESVKDAKGNTTTVTAYNFYNLQPTGIKDPNDNYSEVLHDALGMAVAAAIKGKVTSGVPEADELGSLDPLTTADISAQVSFWAAPEGVDSGTGIAFAETLLGHATWRCVYDLHSYATTGAPVAVAMIGREQHYNMGGGSTPVKTLIRLSYTDGLGRLAMHKVQTEVFTDSSTHITYSWIGGGKTVYNNKGKAVMQYEPYFSEYATYDAAEAAAAHGVTPLIHYDPLGRVIRTDLPDGSYTMTKWDGWKEVMYDNNDTVEIGSVQSAWYGFNSSFPPTDQRYKAAAKALSHADTPTTMFLDTLARPFYTLQANDRVFDNTSSCPTAAWTAVTAPYTTFAELDIEGDRLSVTPNAWTVPTLTYSYNMLKAPAKQVSVDSGAHYLLTDAAGQPLYAWDAADNRITHYYDALRRPVRKEVYIPSIPATNVQEFMHYVDNTPSAKTNNLNGKLQYSYDGAGKVVANSYDFKGNPLSTDRFFTATVFTHPDWSVEASVTTGAGIALESVPYNTSISYDALNRPVQVTSPDSAGTTHTYDRNGLLRSVQVNGVHSLNTSVVDAIYYDAKGQRTKVIYYSSVTGGNVITTYTYDRNTFRVTKIKSTRPTPGGPSGSFDTLQDLQYWYDPIGNITYQTDVAQQIIYFNNAIAAPENDYTYDALYRLIIASGRELSATPNPPASDSDADRVGRPWRNATDTSAMQVYTEYFLYDAVGNMLVQQHCSAAGTGWTRTNTTSASTNQLASSTVGSSTETYVHDLRGNMTGGMSHLSSMGYNTENRLETVVGAGGGTTTYYQYDGGGQRVRKVVINGTIGKSRKYVGQWELYTEYNTTTGTISLARETLNVMDDTTRVALIDSEVNPSTGSLISQNNRYQFSNHLGTATLELDISANVISYEEYYPYGGTSYQSGPNNTPGVSLKRYRYIGKERDEETGFYYMGARYYVPWLCRWVAVDPLESKYTPESCYCYCHNNPIKWTDKTGMGPGIDFGFKARLSLTFGTKGQSRANFALGIGASKSSSKFMDGANFSLNLYTGGPGTNQANTGKQSFGIAATLGLSGTWGGGKGTPTDLNMFNSSTLSGIKNNFNESYTVGTNITWNNATGFNRAAGYAFKKGGFTATINEDYSALPWGSRGGRFLGGGLLASGKDDGETGGGFAGYTFKNGTSLFAGTEIFTGTPLHYPKTPSAQHPGFVEQSPRQQLLNVGRTFLMLQGVQGGDWRLDYSGNNNMFSQNGIHSLIGIDHFRSTATNSVQLTH